jgi:DNA (cytosine-5)-methyltransferase 1
VDTDEIKKLLNGEPLHLLAGCPPCQGFSRMRRLNKRRSRRDDRNNLVWEYLRFVRELKPLSIMMENVPGLINYTPFRQVVAEVRRLGYNPTVRPVRIQEYGIPQRRRRLVLVGSLLGHLNIAEPTKEKMTVRDAIGGLEPPSKSKDPIHRIVKVHTAVVMERIRATPKNGGSRADVPEFALAGC